MTITTTHDLVEELWRKQRAWSRAADRAKSEVERFRLLSLVLVVLAAALGTAAPVLAPIEPAAGRIAGVVAGVSLGLLPLVRRRLRLPTYERWSRLRSISEAIKAEIYRYLAGVRPYRGEDKVRVLFERTGRFLNESSSGDLVGLLRKSDEEVRPLPDIHDVPSYIEVRARRQIERYYEPKRQAMRRRARIVRAAQVVLGAISVALGLVAGLGATSLAPWIGVVGTVSGAVIAHSAAARYGFLELEYARTADELKRTITRYSIHEQDEESDDALVRRCERVISYQNEAWMAELIKERGDDPEIAIAPPIVD
jgi:hypothetical protein